VEFNCSPLQNKIIQKASLVHGAQSVDVMCIPFKKFVKVSSSGQRVIFFTYGSRGMELAHDPRLWAELSEYSTRKLVSTSTRCTVLMREVVLRGVDLGVKHLLQDYNQKSPFIIST
jgi:hypothetical protein